MNKILLRYCLTSVGPWCKPQAAVVDSCLFQGDPHPHNSAQRLRVQESGVLVRRHWEIGRICHKHGKCVHCFLCNLFCFPTFSTNAWLLVDSERQIMILYQMQ